MRTFSQLSKWFYGKATIRSILLFLVLLIVFAVWVFPALQARMQTVPALDQLDIRFGFTVDEAYAYLAALGENGRQVYWWTELVADGLFPVIYTVSAVLVISYFFGRLFPAGSIWRKLNLLPLMVMLADYLENIGILVMLSGFPAPNEAMAQLASVANLIKWGLAPAIIILIMIGVGGWLYSKFGRTGTRP